MQLNDITVGYSQVRKTFDRLAINEAVSGYYEQLAYDDGKELLLDISERVRICNNYWFFDTYRKAKIKDLKSINRCKNKFCGNCQKAIQASRLYNFSPVIESAGTGADLFHIVFTIPNMPGAELKDFINRQFVAFKRLVQYLRNEIKIKGLGFKSYGYLGAVRNLEVTYREDSFHPHLHCIFCFKRGSIDTEQKHINDYSYNRGKFERSFSDFEILLQKIWYLLINKIRVTVEAIDGLEQGYSCYAEKVNPDSYYELFKYAFKTSDEGHGFMNYEQFKTLYRALYRRRCIQGYGCFYDYNWNSEDEILETTDERYNEIIDRLMAEELPVDECLNVPTLLEGMSRQEFIIISRKNIQRYLMEEEKDRA